MTKIKSSFDGEEQYYQVSAEELELLQEFYATLLRYRDFRADSLLRIIGGNLDGVTSRDIVVKAGLRYAIEGGGVTFFRYPDGGPPQGGTDTRIRCPGGWWLRIY